VRKVLKDRQLALAELVKAIGEFRKFTDQPLTLWGGDYAGAVQALNKAIERAELLYSGWSFLLSIQEPYEYVKSLLQGGLRWSFPRPEDLGCSVKPLRGSLKSTCV